MQHGSGPDNRTSRTCTLRTVDEVEATLAGEPCPAFDDDAFVGIPIYANVQSTYSEHALQPQVACCLQRVTLS